MTIYDTDGYPFNVSQFRFMNLTFETDVGILSIDAGDLYHIVANGVAVGSTVVRASALNCVATSDGPSCSRVVSAPVDVFVFPRLTVMPGRVSLLPDAKYVVEAGVSRPKPPIETPVSG